MEIKTKEDIIAIDKAMDELEERAKKVAKYLGLFDGPWAYESFCIGKTAITVTAFDYGYDLHDTKTITFPMECMVDEEFLHAYKIQREAEEQRAKERREQAEQKRKEEQERAEYERLKAIYGEPSDSGKTRLIDYSAVENVPKTLIIQEKDELFTESEPGTSEEEQSDNIAAEREDDDRCY